MTIWKFPLSTVDSQPVRMPLGAEVLCVQTQDEAPCLWALVDPSQPEDVRHFRTHGTGHEVERSDGLRYIGTYQLLGGALIFHVFEETYRV